MSSLSFLTDPDAGLVADASVIINLNATQYAAQIIRAFPVPMRVTENACAELKQGARNGHRDYERLLELIEAGLVCRVPIDIASAKVYEGLIDGSAQRTLDDGEAATIANAHASSCIALIDERKARSLCAASFPTVIVACTAELLTHDAVAAALGAEHQTQALLNALSNARMRVPPEHLDRVTAIIGPERAAMCPSLPKGPRGARPPRERTTS
jgi:predicted nucleic acid-binding protein